MILSLLTLATFGAAASPATTPPSDSILATWWGESTEDSLASYCQKSKADTFVVGGVTNFGDERNWTLTINGRYANVPGTLIPDVSSVGDDIKTCQSLGKKVLLTIGGYYPSNAPVTTYYSLDDAGEGVTLANEVWNSFGGGNSTLRPFGQGVVFDGFEIYNSAGQDSAGWVPLANTLRQLFSQDSSKKYVIATSGPCQPSFVPTQLFTQPNVDYWFIDAFNGCQLNSEYDLAGFQTLAQTQSANKDVKLIPTLIADNTNGAYVDLATVQNVTLDLLLNPSFDGYGVRDVAHASSNIENGVSFIEGVYDILHPGSVNPVSDSASVTISPSTAVVLAPSSTKASAETTTTHAEAATTAAAAGETVASHATAAAGETVASHATAAAGETVASHAASAASTSAITYTAVGTPSISTVAPGVIVTYCSSSSGAALTTATFGADATVTLQYCSTSPAPVVPQYTTVTGTYLTTVPCTILATPASGSPYETVGETSMWYTYTSTVPCDTQVVVPSAAPTAASDVVTVWNTQTVYETPYTVISGTAYPLVKTTKTYTEYHCSC